MKKIVMIFAAMAAMAAMAAVLSSCSKSELGSVSENESKDIVLNISVSNPGAETKALIKTAWAADDEISIWYDENVQEKPDLVITYNGTKWIQKEGATVSGKTPSTSGGYAKALYNGTVKVASKDDYTYENNTLTFDITNWVFLTEIQVVVYGDDINWTKQSDYTLSCDKFTPCTGCNIGANGITATTGTEGTAVTGIINDGVNSKSGVAFVFATADYSTSSTDKKYFAFTLKDNTSGSVVTKVYKPNVAIEAKANKASIKALTIASGKFEAPGPEYVVMQMGTGDGAYTRKWATMNLGATTVAVSGETCYGHYYAWGEKEPYYATRTWDSTNKKWNFNTWNTNKTSGYGWQSYCGGKSTFKEWSPVPYDDNQNLTTEYDVVQNEYPGTKWRMPTSQEFKDLADACGGASSYDMSTNPSGASASLAKKGIYWCTNYEGVAGCLFYDGTNRLFFPAAGASESTSHNKASTYGYYWSSSLYPTMKAYFMYIYKNSFKPQNNDRMRYQGHSVRPVSD